MPQPRIPLCCGLHLEVSRERSTWTMQGERSKQKMKRILSIDGGGLKGALPAAFLAEIEEATGKRIVDHFDLIAGTSTGGIIAIGLGLGIPAQTILDFYVNEGPAVFRQDRPHLWVVEKFYRTARRVRRAKYAPDQLKRALIRILGDSLIGTVRRGF